MNKLGLSGDLITINGNVITKTCLKTNLERFSINIIKQLNFENKHIQSLKINTMGKNNQNKLYIEMPFLKCGNCMEWISKSNMSLIQKLENKLLEYFNDLIKNSQVKLFDYSLWNSKIADLKSKITDHQILEVLNQLSKMTFNNLFYYGDYHGDFTLTNLFVYNNQENQIQIEAIDFLQSFIESPLNDLVKLRQDSKHLWTLHLINDFGKIDINRVIIFLNHLDQKIEQFINQNAILKEYYLPFQILNLARIIPYNSEEKTFDYLKENILNLSNDLIIKKDIHQ